MSERCYSFLHHCLLSKGYVTFLKKCFEYTEIGGHKQPLGAARPFLLPPTVATELRCYTTAVFYKKKDKLNVNRYFFSEAIQFCVDHKTILFLKREIQLTKVLKSYSEYPLLKSCITSHVLCKTYFQVVLSGLYTCGCSSFLFGRVTDFCTRRNRLLQF